MNFKSLLSKPLATWVVRNQKQCFKNPVRIQQNIFHKLIQQAKHTLFGRAHNFNSIRTHEDFKQYVPIRAYEDFTGYIEQIKGGESDVLWPGSPIYFAKTSGTTGGDKHIPITKESIKHHIVNARNALLYYVNETSKTDFLKRKMIFLSGSPQLTTEANILTGRLSGIVNHHVPSYLRGSQLPSYATNCIPDWETKLDKIVEETLQAQMGLISGIPPWVQMYFDKLTQETGKHISEIFPDFSLLVHGGVNFEPYRHKLFDSIGKAVDTIETYPASEGFIAFQDSQQEKGLLLQLDSGMFFEFIPTISLASPTPKRLSIEEVELGVDYALVLSSNAGLWAYMLGDTIKFISLEPPRIVVTGRVKHFISAFGEHVIIEEIEKAMQFTLNKYPQVRVTEFTVAPWVSKQAGEDSYHEWLIEFSYPPQNITTFASELNRQMCLLNSYYKDLIEGNILSTLKVTSLQSGAFKEYMRQVGKLGEQNKIVRVANDRKIADAVTKYKISDL
ncbi:hypothetical protein Aasi_0468 [Candidatus Amoebophilus asiaticus 5a2]|uniref:GH3 auxin-responsive promoter n=1 Tax=Amoebophilus asiaticus (strain 5a2) TaxID=452471 RepID=B3ERM6_AMOA5|nr:GH3 auxin-responsive promoter family protein [Candidatus Amoebophilus asiaticus]ACE05878.1 hypothetical protein Aasi_0468 [Candidatus Amoebophilus asiaticus 5a2]